MVLRTVKTREKKGSKIAVQRTDMGVRARPTTKYQQNSYNEMNEKEEKKSYIHNHQRHRQTTLQE